MLNSIVFSGLVVNVIFGNVVIVLGGLDYFGDIIDVSDVLFYIGGILIFILNFVMLDK